MHITVTRELAEAIGLSKFKPFGVATDSWNSSYGRRVRETQDIGLASLSDKKRKDLLGLLRAHEHVNGTKVLINEIVEWEKALSDATSARPKSVKAFSSMLCLHMMRVPGKRVYVQQEHGAADLAYYVNAVHYYPQAKSSNGYTTPAHCVVRMLYSRYGVVKAARHTFQSEDIRGRSVGQVLAEQGIRTETMALRAEYLEDVRRFEAVYDHVGQQCLADGMGELDINDLGRDEDRRWYSKTERMSMSRGGVPARVVVDVRHEGDKEEKPDRDESHVDHYFWRS